MAMIQGCFSVFQGAVVLDYRGVFLCHSGVWQCYRAVLCVCVCVKGSGYVTGVLCGYVTLVFPVLQWGMAMLQRCFFCVTGVCGYVTGVFFLCYRGV